MLVKLLETENYVNLPALDPALHNQLPELWVADMSGAKVFENEGGEPYIVLDKSSYLFYCCLIEVKNYNIRAYKVVSDYVHLSYDKSKSVVSAEVIIELLSPFFDTESKIKKVDLEAVAAELDILMPYAEHFLK